MIRTVYKYELGNHYPAVDVILLCRDSKVVKAGVQRGKIHLWIEVTTSCIKEYTRTFRVYATGQALQEEETYDNEHVDTVFIGDTVWHIYEQVPKLAYFLGDCNDE